MVGRERVVVAVEVAVRGAFAASAPVTDAGWREDAEKITDAALSALGRRGLIDADAAGELLSVPKSWLLAEARADRIPHVRLGRYVRFDPDELEAWWRRRAQGPSPATRRRR